MGVCVWVGGGWELGARDFLRNLQSALTCLRRVSGEASGLVSFACSLGEPTWVKM